MSRRTIITPAVATVVAVISLLAVSTAPATASGTKITVRIEGAKRTLLAGTSVQAPASGSLTKDGAPAGKCSSDTAAGALEVATKGSWGGSWSSTYDDYLITEILGDTESGTTSYWEILVNNVAASTGACEIKLQSGEQLLFAAVPLSGTGYPLVVKAPSGAKVGSPVKVTVDEVNGKGAEIPLAGATVSGAGTKASTNAKGIARLTVKHVGTLSIGATKTGYVRAAPVKVKVTS